MKFLFCRASEDDYLDPIEINTLEELIKLKKEYGHDLVITENYQTQEPKIIVYDDYLE